MNWIFVSAHDYLLKFHCPLKEKSPVLGFFLKKFRLLNPSDTLK